MEENSQEKENSREMDGLLKVADGIHAVRRKIAVGLRKPHVLKIESEIAAVEDKIAAVEQQTAAIDFTQYPDFYSHCQHVYHIHLFFISYWPQRPLQWQLQPQVNVL